MSIVGELCACEGAGRTSSMPSARSRITLTLTLQRISAEIWLMLGSLVWFIQLPSTGLSPVSAGRSLITLKIACYVLLEAVSDCEQGRCHAANFGPSNFGTERRG